MTVNLKYTKKNNENKNNVQNVTNYKNANAFEKLVFLVMPKSKI